MKKYIFLTVFSIIGVSSFAQTTVFQKNQETARVNEQKLVSKTVIDEFVISTNISSEKYNELISIMINKDGYVSCILEGQKLKITHENWIPIKDIQDVLLSVNISVKHILIETEQILK